MPPLSRRRAAALLLAGTDLLLHRLLMGIDPTYHPDPPAPTRVQPGDRFVVRKSGSGDCGDGTSLLYLLPAPVS